MRTARINQWRLAAVIACAALAAACASASPNAGHGPLDSASASAPNSPTSAPPSAPASVTTSTSAQPSVGPSSGPAPSSTPAAASAVPAGFRPVSVTFVSPDAGFVLGDSPCATGTCTSLVKTDDAGRHWSLVATLPPSVVGDDPAVAHVRFADARDGWAFGRDVWSTHDGGRAWKQVMRLAQVTDLEASGGQAYALLGDHLLRTPVAQDGWNAVDAPIGTSPRTIALHGHAVWIAGPNALAFSADGTTWQALPSPCASLGIEWQLTGVAPVDAASVYFLCSGGAGAGSEAKKVLYSKDSGTHSAPTASDPPLGGIADVITAASADVVAVSARSGASFVYRSGDGGASWQTPLQQGDGGVGYFDLGFTTATQGVAIYGQPGSPVKTQLLMTRDAGAHWAPVAF